MVYGETGETSSPTFLQATVDGSAMRIWLSHADGLKTGDSGMGDFDLLDEKGSTVHAEAKIEKVGDKWTILVSSPTVKAPTGVRYAWSRYITHFVYNSAGLPLGTFSTERIPAHSLPQP